MYIVFSKENSYHHKYNPSPNHLSDLLTTDETPSGKVVLIVVVGVVSVVVVAAALIGGDGAVHQNLHLIVRVAAWRDDRENKTGLYETCLKVESHVY